eukprot:gene10483-21863_t
MLIGLRLVNSFFMTWSPYCDVGWCGTGWQLGAVLAGAPNLAGLRAVVYHHTRATLPPLAPVPQQT